MNTHTSDINILTTEITVKEFGMYMSCLNRDAPLPHGLCVVIGGCCKVYIHFSTICFWVVGNELRLLNTPSASEKFIKRCFFEAYCDTMEQFFGVGIQTPPNNITGVKNNLLRITALEKKLKEGTWETCTKNMG